jgi:selenophosphate synthase
VAVLAGSIEALGLAADQLHLGGRSGRSSARLTIISAGTCATQHVRRNAGAHPRDVPIMTKPIGVGMETTSRFLRRYPSGCATLLADPQTSGGLLIAVAPERGDSILRTIRDSGCPFACIIGHTEEGAPAIKLAA